MLSFTTFIGLGQLSLGQGWLKVLRFKVKAPELQGSEVQLGDPRDSEAVRGTHHICSARGRMTERHTLKDSSPNNQS